MKTLCIDVGIKNLAFCMVSMEDSKPVVELWKNIDILDTARECKVCGKSAKYFNEENEYFCGIHLKGPNRKEIKQISCKTINSGLLCSKLLEGIKFLDELSDVRVFIELQPAKNPKMKLVSHCLFTRCVQLFGHKNVSFMRASMKLKSSDKKEKSSYKDRKNLSVTLTREKLEKYSISHEGFEKETKKNDMADTFLMCSVKCNF